MIWIKLSDGTIANLDNVASISPEPAGAVFLYYHAGNHEKMCTCSDNAQAREFVEALTRSIQFAGIALGGKPGAAFISVEDILNSLDRVSQ